MRWRASFLHDRKLRSFSGSAAIPPSVKYLLFALYTPTAAGFGLLPYLRYIQPWLARMLGAGWAWALIAAYAGAAVVGCFLARRIYFEWTDETPPPPGAPKSTPRFSGPLILPIEQSVPIAPISPLMVLPRTPSETKDADSDGDRSD